MKLKLPDVVRHHPYLFGGATLGGIAIIWMFGLQWFATAGVVYCLYLLYNEKELGWWKKTKDGGER